MGVKAKNFTFFSFLEGQKKHPKNKHHKPLSGVHTWAMPGSLIPQPSYASKQKTKRLSSGPCPTVFSAGLG